MGESKACAWWGRVGIGITHLRIDGSACLRGLGSMSMDATASPLDHEAAIPSGVRPRARLEVVVALLLAIAIAGVFWGTQRYPSLLKKLHSGQHLHVAGAISFDALLKVTDAQRINYAILGNVEPALHAHVMPRYATEPDEMRTAHPWAYDWQAAPLYDRAEYQTLAEALRSIVGRPVEDQNRLKGKLRFPAAMGSR